MNEETILIEGFLNELYRQGDGNPEAAFSMYEIGASLGLEKGAAGTLAEQMMFEGLLELKTLSGGVSITSEGMARIGVTGSAAVSSCADSTLPQLSKGEIASEEDLAVITRLCDQIKQDLGTEKRKYAEMEEAVIDLKTLDVQLLSPKPKLAVVKAVFSSLAGQVEKSAAGSESARLLRSIIG